MTKLLGKKVQNLKKQGFRLFLASLSTKLFLNYPSIFKFSLRAYRFFKSVVNRCKLLLVVLVPIEKVPERTIYIVESPNDFQILRAGISKVETYLHAQLKLNESQGFRVIGVHWNGKAFVTSNQQTVNKAGKHCFKKQVAVWSPSQDDLVFFSSFNEYKRLNTKDFRKIKQRCKIVTSVYDILPLTNPEWFKPHMVTSFRDRFAVAWNHSDLLVVNCNYTKNQIQLLVKSEPSLHKTQCEVEVVHLWDVADLSDFLNDSTENKLRQILNSFEYSFPLVIMISTVEPRKGHVELIEAAKAAWSTGAEFNLLLIGQQGWIDAISFNKFHNFLEGFKSRSIWLSNVNDHLLAQLLNSASILVSPSLSEGFGLPVAEALNMQVPVLANAIPAYKEIFGGAVVFYGKGEEFESLVDSLSNIATVIAKGKESINQFTYPSTNTLSELISAFEGA